MKFMNDYDLDQARARFDAGDTPNRLALVLVVDRLRHWADANSDGWAHWAAPVNAAKTAIEHIESRTSAENRVQERVDIAYADMTKALRPIKSFLTRQGVTGAAQTAILKGAS